MAYWKQADEENLELQGIQGEGGERIVRGADQLPVETNGEEFPEITKRTPYSIRFQKVTPRSIKFKRP